MSQLIPMKTLTAYFSQSDLKKHNFNYAEIAQIFLI